MGFYTLITRTRLSSLYRPNLLPQVFYYSSTVYNLNHHFLFLFLSDCVIYPLISYRSLYIMATVLPPPSSKTPSRLRPPIRLTKQLRLLQRILTLLHQHSLVIHDRDILRGEVPDLLVLYFPELFGDLGDEAWFLYACVREWWRMGEWEKGGGRKVG